VIWAVAQAILPATLYILPAAFSVSPGERLAVVFQNAGRTDAVRDATLLGGAAAYNVTNLRPDAAAVTGDASIKTEGTLIVYAGARTRNSAKALLLSRQPGSGFSRRVGLMLEIVPEADPYTLKPGESLPVQVLLQGKPTPCVVKTQRLDGSGAVMEEKTGGAGKARAPLSGPGKWLISASTADGISSTLTFEVF
jgi:hypothetical protein